MEENIKVGLLAGVMVLMGFAAGYLRSDKVQDQKPAAIEYTILEVVGQYSTDYSFGAGETGFVVKNGDKVEFLPKENITGVMAEEPKFLRQITKGGTTAVEPLFETPFQPAS